MYQRILVPVDGSATSQRGLQEALQLAKLSGGQVQALHVVNELLVEFGHEPSLYHADLVEGLREAGRRVLELAQSAARTQGIELQVQMIEVIGGRAADTILEVAREWPADLIVMGTHGRRGLSRLALGSDAALVVRDASVPVLMVRNAEV